jgi:alkylation response protein AidB-like acyl-CoA dehydrogenase
VSRAGSVAVLARGPAAPAGFADALREWLVLGAATLAGAADGALELATGWVKERFQFGVPVGSFQGVQHGLADLPGLVDGALLLAHEAAWSLDGGHASLTGASGDELALMAALFAADAARAAAARAVQYHGGLGVAVEHDAQLYYRFSRALPLLTGAPRHHLRALGERLLAAPEPTAGQPTGTPPDLDGTGFGHPPAAAALADEVRAFTAAALTPQTRHEMRRTGTVHAPALHRAMSARGWLAATRDGAPRDARELAALFRELELADAPYHGMSTTMIVAGVVETVGAPALRAKVLPRMLSGDAVAVLGYSEPGSGSDVAAARTRAEPVDAAGTAWRINGQKMWTTLAHVADYCLLLTRTSTTAAKHRGLTMFLVPLDTPGITIQPIHTIADERTNVVFYDDVVVEDEYRLGDVDDGWRVMAVGLSMERGVMGGTAYLEPLVAAALAWSRLTGPDGTRPADDPGVIETIARARVDAEVAFLLTQHTARLGTAGRSPAVAGTIAKLFASSAYQRAARDLQDLAGVDAILGTAAEAGPGAGETFAGELERAARHCAVVTIQGGTTEIARNLVAEQRLGLPKTRQGTRAASAAAPGQATTTGSVAP